MNKKINKIIIIFCILIMAIPIFSFGVSATESTIKTGIYQTSVQENSIVVDNNGNLFSAYRQPGALRYVRVEKSVDNGETWSETTSVYVGSSDSPLALSLFVNDDGNIFMFYSTEHGGTFFLKYKIYNGVSWSGETTLISFGSGFTSDYGIDVAGDSDNLFVVYSYRHSSNRYIKFARYNYFMETWSAISTVLGGGGYSFSKPCLTIYNNDLYLFFSNNSNIEYGKYGIDAGTWSMHVEHDTAFAYSGVQSFLYNNKLCLLYQGTTATSNGKTAILYKELADSEQIICEDENYNQNSPHPSVNSNGNINAVWSGTSVVSSVYNQIRQCIYSGGEWGSVAYITSGAKQKRYPQLLYQDNPSFTHLVSGISMVYFNDTDDSLIYLDSDSLIWYSDDEYPGDFEFEANRKIGNLDTGCTMGFAHVKTIEFKYMIPTTINATGFDLLVNSVMHDYDSDLSNYDLYINGESMGNPTEWKGYGGQHVLRWTFAEEKVIINSEILFEVWHDFLIHNNYWYIGISCNYEDLDGDGVGFLKQNIVYPNGAFDGTWLDKDVAYQLYYNIIQFVEDETTVTYNSISVENTSYYIGESVSLTYTIKATDLVYDNYVRIWNDDTATEITTGSMQGFPYLCTHQLETIGFVSFTSANYTAHLYINNVETDNVSFFVDEHINSDMHVFTYPNPSLVGQKIWVSYNYDHPTNKSGAIFVSLTPNLNNYISVNYLSDGDNGFWNCKHDTVGTYYYIMAVDIDGSGTYSIVDNGIYAHSVRSEHGNNYFTLSSYNLRLNEEGTVTQVVNGECNMVSGNCYIYDNNQLVKTITESPFSYNYEIHTAGLHSVEMRLITNITTVLCTQNYTVSTYSGEDEIEQVEDIGFIVKDYLYNNYGDFGIFIAGVLIILGFMLIPLCLVLCVNVKFNKNMDVGDIHWSMYLIFAIVGVIVVIQLHLADLWIVLLICIVSITITVLTYTKNR